MTDTVTRAALIEAIMAETTDDIVSAGGDHIGRPNVLVQGCKYIRRTEPAGTQGYAKPEEAALKFAGFIADSVLTMLAAAPKAEPVSDPYKLDLSDVRSKLSEIVNCSHALRQGGPAPDDIEELSDALDLATGLADDILADVVWADPSIPLQSLSNPQQLPAAPKVEQEPCSACLECGCHSTRPAKYKGPQ